MKIRVSSRRAGVGVLVFALGSLAVAPGCSTDGRSKSEEQIRVGQVKLPLQTVGSAGNVYRLREGRFRISSVETGETLRTVRTERDPFTSVIGAEVPAGEHSVHLLEGWFLERVTFDGGSGGSGGAAPGDGDGDIFIGDGDGDIFIDEDESDGDSDGDIFIDDGDGDGDIFIGDGDGDGDSFEVGEVVPAQLLSDAIQQVTVEANEEEFVLYTFLVGDEVVQFGPGEINIGIEVIEEPTDPDCPDVEQVQRRAVFETVRSAVSAFSMEEVFQSLSTNAELNTSGQRLYQEAIDSYATAEEGLLTDAVHCGDEQTDGSPSLNGFPIECNREERFQFDNLNTFFATAVVNRLDLAPENGAHCGQQRVIFASNALNRMFFIFEAQVPNPQPELGLGGCQPLADFWAAQASIDDPVERGERLREAFVDGAPELEAQGIGPFMSAANLTVGSGQIRTNQFDSSPWTLREFKLATSGDELTVVPFPVAEAPNGVLWNDTVDTPQGPECRDAFLASLGNLLSDDPAEMSFPIPEECRDAESRNDFSQNYAGHLMGGDPEGFQAQLAEALEGTGLTPVDIANRAHFAGSCIGCHEEAVGRDLGNDVTSPFSNSFVHVDEFGGGDCDDGPCFTISPALRDVFLPHRLGVLSQFVSLPEDVDCGGTGTGGASGTGGSLGMGGAGVPPATGGPLNLPPASSGTPAPVVEVELPKASLSIDRMVRREQRIRARFGDRTIGGQSARQSH